jgi:predicted nuclease with TOPRIM domain
MSGVDGMVEKGMVKRIAELEAETKRLERDYKQCFESHSDLRQRLDEAQAWKNAVIEAAVVDWTLSTENKDNPRRAINDLLVHRQQIALDPRVSQQAHDMVKRAEKAEQQRDDAQRTLDSVIAAKNTIEQQRDEALALLRVFCRHHNPLNPYQDRQAVGVAYDAAAALLKGQDNE